MDKSKGTLYIIATPIGNFKDISYRAVEVLKAADLLACEDTRQTGHLMKFLNIKKPLTSYHSYNKLKKEEMLVRKLREGLSIALVTDGGTPGISDPGADIVRTCRENGIKVIPVPGPSAIAAALSVSGFGSNKVYFAGFLSPKSSRRRRELMRVMDLAQTVVCYESPFRIRAFLKDILQVYGNVEVFIAREMTKTYEEYLNAPVSDMIEANFKEKGEFTVIINLKNVEKKLIISA